ncbi:phage integrase family protein [Burkholderia sp. MSHR3999]|nr:phage integrase family protein [Burkholderia sp. MSHR3999]
MPDLSEAERRKPAGTSPHAFRCTVGTQMLAAGVAPEVVQRKLEHASLGAKRRPNERCQLEMPAAQGARRLS